jgi:hypothetical protein
MSNNRVPSRLREILDDSGLEWQLKDGGRHMKLIICGKLITVMPKSRTRNTDNMVGRAHLNVLAAARRTIRALKETK